MIKACFATTLFTVMKNDSIKLYLKDFVARFIMTFGDSSQIAQL